MKKKISVLLALLFIVLTFSACGKYKEPVLTETNLQKSGFKITYLSSADTEAEIDLHTDRMETYLEGEYDNIKRFAGGVEAFDKDNVITYSYSEPFTLTISENEDMSDGWSFRSKNNEVKIDSLKTGAKYYVTATVGEKTINLDDIITDNCLPRVINVEGVKNVRDIGGYKTSDGATVRQGLVFRCGRLNESDTDTVNIEITEKGRETMLGRLGVKTEIDLRVVENDETGRITESPLGPTVQYLTFPMSYANDFYLDSKDMVRDVFRVFADEDNYPIIFHCNIGTDRTGMIAYMLNGLLGVDESDLFRDYAYSNFADIGGSRSIDGMKDHSYYKEIQAQPGDTLSEKIHSLLLELGVTEQEIQNIVSIMKY